MTSPPRVVEVSGHKYRIGTLNAFDQLHVAKRLAPAWANFTKIDTGSVAGDLAETIGKLSDEDLDFIIITCLSVVARQEGEAWAKVCSGKTVMYADIGMKEMLGITYHVVEDNFSDFFLSGPQTSRETVTTTTQTA